MSQTDSGQLAKKFRFLLLTLAVSSAVVFGMVVTSGTGDQAGTVETAASQAAPRPAVVQPETAPPASGQDKDEVVPAQRKDESELPLPKTKKGPDASLFLPNIADIVEQANAAVVNIRATEIIRAGTKERRRNPHNPFEFFFPRPDGGDGQGEDDDRRQDSGGTGFIVTEDGYIMTNYHVIEDADRIVIRLKDDNRDYVADVIGTDELTDLALLKIDSPSQLPTIPLGDSQSLRVGEWVIAIGNPLIYDHTVTVGVVSAKGRKLAGLSRDVSLDNYIQTDAAINRGNSGGPLLNLRGEAIGINSAISVAGQGISFAIPINMARDVMVQLRESGTVSRGFLGVTIVDIQTELRSEERDFFGLNEYQGAFIQSVTQGNPADVAGVKRGDAIVTVDGQNLQGSDDLIRTISSKKPGSKVALGVIRDGRPIKLTAELINRPTPQATVASSEPGVDPDEPVSDRRLGITVEELSPDVRREYRLDGSTEGVVVTHVSQVSQAWERGLRAGDVILEVNREPVSSLEDYRGVLDGLATGDTLVLYIRSPGISTGRFVSMTVGQD